MTTLLPSSFISSTTHRSRRGFTLPEMLVAVGISAVVLTALVLTGMTCLRGFAGMYNYTDMNMTSRLALDDISKEIRGATGVNSVSATKLVLVNTNLATTTTYTLNAD